MPDPPLADQFLERAILLTIVAHALAMISMALLLMPGIPGGISFQIADRAHYVADHPWLWRLGWLPWQITAISDLVVGIALLFTAWIPKLPSLIAVAATIGGMIPDQTSQIRWTWIGPAIARHANSMMRLDAYARLESHWFLRIAGWGTVGYLIAAIAWTWCFHAAGIWSRRLAWISAIVWPLFGAATALLLLIPTITGRPTVGAAPLWLMLVGIGNGICFVLLMIWLFDVSELVLRRSRPDERFGRYARWRHPSSGILWRICDVIANSRTVRALGEFLPSLAMKSDITDVVYVNYLLDADLLEKLVKPPLRLQRLGPEGRFSLFTFLTYRHGHFGPSCFGPLRKIWPSPIQSNWRIHVIDPLTGLRGIQFLTIAITGTPYALVARTVAEAIPMHVPAKAHFQRDAGGVIEMEIIPGKGTSPQMEGVFTPATEPGLTHPWSDCFATWREFLEYCVRQDRAMSVQPWYQQVTRQEIILDISLDKCEPMSGVIDSITARAIAGEAAPLCFGFRSVPFRLLREEHDIYRSERVSRT